MLMDTMPNVNKTLCSGTERYDNGFDLHFVHPGKPMYEAPEGLTVLTPKMSGYDQISLTRTTTPHQVENHARFESKADALGVQDLRPKMECTM